MDSKRIGARLRELRGNRTQKEVGDACGVSDMAISLYESGERIPRDETKIALAAFFKTSVDAIFFAE